MSIGSGTAVFVNGPMTLWGSSGTSLTINTGTLWVTGTATVAAGGQLSTGGGEITTGNLVNNGTINISNEATVVTGVATIA